MFNSEYDNAYHITPLHDLSDSPLNNLGIPDWLTQINKEFDEALLNGKISIRQLVTARATAIDELLTALFTLYKLDRTDLTLFATGGYGRGELSLHSDVDILLLSPDTIDETTADKINEFVAKLWDIGIDPALAVRSVDECLADAKEHTIATALLEARFLIGNEALTNLPQEIVNKAWSQTDFYQIKLDEAKARYKQHNATEYNLEPDIKTAPGGLRDIHIIGWVSKRYFRVNKLFDLVQQDFLTEKEFDELSHAEDFLWTIRHHLHTITNRNENKLLFDHQRRVAERMGYDRLETEHNNANIERLMRDYYRCAMLISTLSEMLIIHYYEALIESRLPDKDKPTKTPLTALFNQYGTGDKARIAIAHNKVFAQHPEAILQMFLLMGQHNIKEVRTRTLRALKIASRGIDEQYRTNPAHQQLFLANIKEQNYLYHRLRTMKRYGVLGGYLPAFAQVTGLMQYDLFHRYTVDAHTLLLIRYLHRFTDEKYDKEFALVNSIYQRIDRKDILSLAAIFHDIAKGRGGNHSELGEKDAIDFCLLHGMSQADANLVGWLVKQHLLMSMTAQKKDISDPEEVAKFAEAVGNVTHLNHLYVLTVADMNATNSQIWNSWRASLMKQLYTYTRRILRADLDAPTNRLEMIKETRQKAEQLLNKMDDDPSQKMNPDEVITLWDELGDEYFLREIPADIIWHTKEILNHPPIGSASDDTSEPLVALREHRDLALDAVQVFVYTQDQDNLFAVTMAVFDKMDLDVMDARIITGTRDFALDSYVILDRQGTLLTDTERQAELQQRLINAFKNPQEITITKKRMPRRLKHFDVPTKIAFALNENNHQHTMNITTLDRPSLLAQIGQIFLEQGIEVHSARITTLGEKAEDMFFISDKKDKVLSEGKLEILKQAIIERLDD
ncbi:MAG: [protein-PII] uridylyltransferase [Pseudomonadales bacterium]|nr:MAG: [protein-PII] uridylyltransferase [Pseudomonadales bacterium]